MKKTKTKRAAQSCRRKQTIDATKKVRDLIGLSSRADLNGSYTGKPWNSDETPVQDADDL